MSIGEIEKAVPQLSAEELVKLEQVIRKTRREKEKVRKPSLRDIEPVSVGEILQPLGTRDQWYDEMREARA
jgi:Cu2+-containing amine oxidase